MYKIRLQRTPRALGAALFLGLLAGCTDGNPFLAAPQSNVEGAAEILSEEVLVEIRDVPVVANISDTYEPSLVADSPLGKASREAELKALSRSSAVFSVSAAEGDAAAIRAERYPKILPVAGVSVSGDRSVGLSVEQEIWNFGNRRARLDRTETQILVARVEQWIELNEAVFDALDAYLSYQRSQERLTAFTSLDRDVRDLAATVEGRFSGGVAGRGETLEISLILQEVARDILDEKSEQAAAALRYRSLVGPNATSLRSISSMKLLNNCRPGASAPEPPEALRGRLIVQQALDDQTILQSRRFPKIVGTVDTRHSGGSWDTSAGLGVDASELLGWDRRARLEASEQRLQGAQQEYRNILEVVKLDVDQLRAEYSRQQASLSEIAGLQKSARENEALFEDLFESGNATLEEGLQLSRESNALQRTLSDQRIDLLRTCLRIGRIQGTLIIGGPPK